MRTALATASKQIQHAGKEMLSAQRRACRHARETSSSTVSRSRPRRRRWMPRRLLHRVGKHTREGGGRTEPSMTSPRHGRPYQPRRGIRRETRRTNIAPSVWPRGKVANRVAAGHGHPQRPAPSRSCPASAPERPGRQRQGRRASWSSPRRRTGCPHTRQARRQSVGQGLQPRRRSRAYGSSREIAGAHQDGGARRGGWVAGCGARSSRGRSRRIGHDERLDPPRDGGSQQESADETASPRRRAGPCGDRDRPRCGSARGSATRRH